MANLIKILFFVFGIVLLSSCSKYAPLEEKDMIENGPSFYLKNGDSSSFDGDNEGDEDGITDPDDDDDEIDTDSDGITDPDDDDDEIPGSGDNGKSPGGDEDSGGKENP